MKEINYYSIGYSSYEDSCYDILTHTKKFTEQDIEYFLVEYINSRKNLPSKTLVFSNTLSEIIPYHFISFLCRRKGFKRVKFTVDFSRFGWPDIFDKNDWKSERKELDPITDKLIRKREIKDEEI